ncbi:MAG: glycerophosphodiester phosphodiesterase family protein [Thermodesulfobacteriota bacterium]
MTTPGKHPKPRAWRRAFFLTLLLVLAAAPARAQAADAPPPLAVEIFAHRGHHLVAPENSLAALRAAVELGLHGSEIDLRTTRDGQVVLMHDADLDRASDGRGPLASRSLAELRRLRLKDARGRLTGERIPTLEEALDLVQAQPGFRLVLDLKQVDAAQVARQVRQKGLDKQVVFFIADPQDVTLARSIHAVGPDLILAVDLLGWWKIEGLARFAAHALQAKALFASEWFFPRCGFAEAKEAGAEVMAYLWGDHDLPARLGRAAALGAAVVSSDRPDFIIDLVRPRRAAGH